MCNFLKNKYMPCNKYFVTFLKFFFFKNEVMCNLEIGFFLLCGDVGSDFGTLKFFVLCCGFSP